MGGHAGGEVAGGDSQPAENQAADEHGDERAQKAEQHKQWLLGQVGQPKGATDDDQVPERERHGRKQHRTDRGMSAEQRTEQDTAKCDLLRDRGVQRHEDQNALRKGRVVSGPLDHR